MVCVPCIFIPVLLYIWHKFIQPYVLKFWNPWAKKDEKGDVVQTEFPFTCSGGACPFPSKNKGIDESKTDKTNEELPIEDKSKSD
ncbi:UPF0729 protein AAEL015238 [Arctopsyche grandis]|uniref:UPF0729 protein AAEL015238 n=1 Tax=Arctopsyche grandis TaxID=121162 RepID=UPI00406D6703